MRAEPGDSTRITGEGEDGATTSTELRRNHLNTKVTDRRHRRNRNCETTTSNISQEEPELTYQIIELYPDEEADEKTVTLNGLMPEGAEATAVDVSDEHDGVAAYDITITDGETAYQPGEENPIKVEIIDPVITESENIQLWHIHDDGTREQIFDFDA